MTKPRHGRNNLKRFERAINPFHGIKIAWKAVVPRKVQKKLAKVVHKAEVGALETLTRIEEPVGSFVGGAIGGAIGAGFTFATFGLGTAATFAGGFAGATAGGAIGEGLKRATEKLLHKVDNNADRQRQGTAEYHNTTAIIESATSLGLSVATLSPLGTVLSGASTGSAIKREAERRKAIKKRKHLPGRTGVNPTTPGYGVYKPPPQTGFIHAPEEHTEVTPVALAMGSRLYGGLSDATQQAHLGNVGFDYEAEAANPYFIPGSQRRQLRRRRDHGDRDFHVLPVKPISV